MANINNTTRIQALSFSEYVAIAQNNGLGSLRKISEATLMSYNVAQNLSSGRTKETEWQERYFYLDARDRGWIE